MSKWSEWMWVTTKASTPSISNGSRTNGWLRKFGWSFSTPDIRIIWWPFFMLPAPWLRLPVPVQRSQRMLVPWSDLIQIPVQPNHHIAKEFGSTCLSRISSLSQVPHSGKVSRNQVSFVTSWIVLIIITSIVLFIWCLHIHDNAISDRLQVVFMFVLTLNVLLLCSMFVLCLFCGKIGLEITRKKCPLWNVPSKMFVNGVTWWFRPSTNPLARV